MLGARDVYGDVLIELGTVNKDIVVLDADLASSTRTSKFAKKFPDRFFNMGVSEQDMMGTAAGLASAGKIPFCSTFAVFATGRAWEQIRQSICLPKLNVKIVATHGGITVGEDGASHHSTEDIALMRVLPNMTVIVPADGYEAGAAIRTAVKYNGPVYIRLSREKFPVIYPETHEFEIGKANVFRDGEDVTIIAAGLMAHAAMEAADDLRKDGLSAGIINMSTIKPIDSNAILTAARKSGAIVTVEEHSIIGGLGSAVAEVISENEPVLLKRIGINDKFGMSGRPAELLEHYGLTKDAIKKAVYNIVEKKGIVSGSNLLTNP
ncbi:MAG: transketolase family protein [Nitrospinae bacterium]|nr:transketolase family protein [Nitrospinota bacterium]